MHRRMSVALLLLSLALSGCATASHPTPSAAAGSVIYGLDENGRLVAYDVGSGKTIWSHPLSGDSRELVADAQQWHLLVMGDTVYFLYHYLAAYRITDGKQLWQKPISEGTRNPGQLVWGGNILYALVTPDSTSQIYALDPRNGSPIWQRALTNLPVPTGDIPPDEANAAAYHNGTIYLAMDYGAAALNASNGQLIWHDEQQCQCSFNFSTVTWTPQAVLVQAGDVTGLAGNTGIPSVSYVLAVNPVTGKLLWNNFNSAQSADYSAVSPALGLYSVTGTAINSLNPTTGKVLWSVTLSHVDGGTNSITGWCIGPTALVVVTGPTGGDLVAFSAQLGTQLWQYQSTDSFTTLAVGESEVYALGSADVDAFSLASGRLLWRQRQDGTYPDLQISALEHEVLVANPQVASGGPPACAIINASDGKQVWTSDTNGCAFLYVA